MSHKSDLIATDIDAYLAEHEQKDLLRFLTCGSVDDGKSTLIGRLLHDSKMVYEDQLAALHKDSATVGHAGDHVDLALLTDGLKAEREQGITIDVAYRYFSTARRKFIIADTPGHEQYTRNMVTGASTCQLAIILIDARHGVLAQTKRHSFIASLLGIRHVAVAINKMDLVDWSQDRYDEIVADYRSIASALGIEDPLFLPMSALLGDGVVERGENLAWYEGPTMMEHLETVDIVSDMDLERFRFPVQLVLRPDLGFRGFAGTVESGVVHPGDTVRVQPSGTSATIERIVTLGGDLDQAGPGRAVTLTTSEEVDISRGDVLINSDHPLLRSHDVDTMLVWMAEAPMEVGHEYLVQQGNRRLNARITKVRERVDINTLESRPSEELALNDIARVTLVADAELLFDPYKVNRATGSFILIDRMTNATVAAGMIRGSAGSWDKQTDARVSPQVSEVTAYERSIRYGQQPVTVFLTGLTGAGKSTIAKALERAMFNRGRASIRLDGENMRLGLSRDLGFSAQDRSENLRRAAETANLVNNQGIIVVVAHLAPSAELRARASELIGSDRFVEVFLDPPIEVCRERDTNGLYEAADNGTLEDFPGVSAPYDRPDDADLVLDTSRLDVDQCVGRIIRVLDGRGFLAAHTPPVNEPVSDNIVRAEGHLDPGERSRLLGHGSLTVWFTGLSGSGKSTLAFTVEHQLVSQGTMAYVLDGDNIRFGLNRDLGFSPEDREENIRRIGEVCRLMTDSGLVVLSSSISPYRRDRDKVRELHPQGRFIEVFVDTPLEVCEDRDVKGLYAKARAGEIPDFSGVSAPYEAPERPELRIDTTAGTIEECAAGVIEEIRRRI